MAFASFEATFSQRHDHSDDIPSLTCIPLTRPITMSCIRILLADDHEVVRQNLAALLDSRPDIEVVGQANDGQEAVELTHRLHPDVVLMDYNMPTLNGSEATQRISDEVPDVSVIGLSMHDDQAVVQEMKAAGAVMYLSKCAPLKVLLSAIRRVASGDTCFD